MNHHLIVSPYNSHVFVSAMYTTVAADLALYDFFSYWGAAWCAVDAAPLVIKNGGTAPATAKV